MLFKMLSVLRNINYCWHNLLLRRVWLNEWLILLPFCKKEDYRKVNQRYYYYCSASCTLFWRFGQSRNSLNLLFNLMIYFKIKFRCVGKESCFDCVYIYIWTQKWDWESRKFVASRTTQKKKKVSILWFHEELTFFLAILKFMEQTFTTILTRMIC